MSRVLPALALLAAGAAHARSAGIASSSCFGCHGEGAQQTTITTTPSTWNPGDTITVRVAIAGVGSAGGFFLSAGGVGSFATIAGQNTRLVGSDVVHASPKATSGGTVTFDVRWTAPASRGGVDFDAATVLANGDGRSSGDKGGQARASFAWGCAGATYFRDFDGDGFGAASSGTTRNCSAPPGYVASDGDCDDNDRTVAPGAVEACNGRDDNCNGQKDEGLSAVTTWPDADRDGYGAANGAPMTGCAGSSRAANNGDCDDTRADVNPGALEVCNQRDDDCDLNVDDNARVRCGVGWCERIGPTCNPADCDPGPPNPERCNALDDDCDGVVDDGTLCAPGAACVDGRCIDGWFDLDAGTGGAGGSSGGAGGGGGGGDAPRGGCSAGLGEPGLALALLALLAARNRRESRAD